jgi:hypothetical protein
LNGSFKTLIDVELVTNRNLQKLDVTLCQSNPLSLSRNVSSSLDVVDIYTPMPIRCRSSVSFRTEGLYFVAFSVWTVSSLYVADGKQIAT